MASSQPGTYASPFSMRLSCSSRRPMRSPCSLTRVLSARSSCITSSSFPASCKDIGIRGHKAAALSKSTTRQGQHPGLPDTVSNCGHVPRPQRGCC